MNTFRSCDAIEFTRAIDACNGNSDTARQRLSELSERIARIEARREPIPTYLLAAYRGYECVITPMMEVKLDDTL